METRIQKSRSLSSLVDNNDIEVDEPQKQTIGIPKIFRRKSLDLTKINIDSDDENEEDDYAHHHHQLMPIIKISQYNSTNGLNILHQ